MSTTSVQSPPDTQPPRARKKSKTFTGCWTCRARRVKCDEGRPICIRCARSRFTCEGYGLRLGWKRDGAGQGDQNPDSTFKGALFRTVVDLERNIVRQPINVVNDMLQKCCSTTAGPETLSFGPFSVFSALPAETSPLSVIELGDSDVMSPDESPGPQIECVFDGPSSLSSSLADASSIGCHVPDCTTPMPDYASRSVREGSLVISEPFPLSDAEPRHVSNEDLPLIGGPDPPRAPVEDPSLDDEQSDLLHIYNHDDLMSADLLVEDSWADLWPNTPATSTTNHSTSPRSALSMYRIAAMPTSRKEAELIHHWVVFMCKNILPVDTINNPYRVVYLGLASQALDRANECSSGILALFHGMCSAAAESLNNLHRAEDIHAKSTPEWHANAALQHLRLCVASSSVQDDYVSVLAAISMSILRDTVSGQPRNWRVHGQAALGITQRAILHGGVLQPGSSAHVLIEQYLALAAFANLPTQEDLQDLLSRLPDTLNYLPRQHSVTKTILRFVGLINTLSRGSIEPEPEVLDDIELRIYLEAAPCNEMEDMPEQDPGSVIIQHYRHVYYYALLIHFNRVLRHKPPSAFQDLVEEGLHHLETVESLSSDRNGCIILWPCLVIATECEQEDLQKRALKWFRRKSRHAFGSVNTSERICCEYWSWRNEHPVESMKTPWLDFVAETDLDVVPV